MSFLVERFIDTGKQTIGKLLYNDEFICFTLEDTHRDEKVYGETRIKEGRYNLQLREYGGHHEKYKTRFSDIHKGMIQVMDVPNFTDILIHCGNNEGHTHGCLLLGEDVLENDGLYSIGDSSGAYRRAYELLYREMGTITYIDVERYDFCETTAQLLNVRDTPGGDLRAQVGQGSLVKRYFVQDGWALTDYGYMSNKYLEEV